MARWQRPWSAAAVAVLGLAGLLAVSGFGAQRPSVSGAWGKAITLSGQAGAPSAMSCSSPGNCSAVGQLGGGYLYGITQVRGTWTKPAAIRGTARTFRPSSSAGGLACFAAGNCVLAGTYRDVFGHLQAFIVTQTRGTWGKLIWVPGLDRLDRGGNAGLGMLSCPSAGNCNAAGTYTDAKKITHPFTVSQVRGTWGKAAPVPDVTGLPGQTPGTRAQAGPISCAGPGTCATAGSYQFGDPHTQNSGTQAYVDNEVNGAWGTPKPVPGLAALNTGLFASVSVISCPSPGNCTVGGSYAEPAGNVTSFVVNQVNGSWGNAIKVKTRIPGFDGPDGDWFTAISCPSAGNCVAGGVYGVEVDARSSAVFVVSEVNGTWGQAIPVPGTGWLNQGDQAGLSQISCPSAGNCGVAGWYSASDHPSHSQYTQPFVTTEVHGTWNKAIEVPGIKSPPPVLDNSSSSATTTIACPAPDRCSAAGYYQDPKFAYHMFAVSQP